MATPVSASLATRRDGRASVLAPGDPGELISPFRNGSVVGSVKAARMTLEPGWRWSERIGYEFDSPAAQTFAETGK
jgi:hypothetical protein